MTTERSTPEPVAIGDTFHRVGDAGGAWEVTEASGLNRGWWLERGNTHVIATTRQLLDRALWTPARCV